MARVPKGLARVRTRNGAEVLVAVEALSDPKVMEHVRARLKEDSSEPYGDPVEVEGEDGRKVVTSSKLLQDPKALGQLSERMNTERGSLPDSVEYELAGGGKAKIARGSMDDEMWWKVVQKARKGQPKPVGRAEVLESDADLLDAPAPKSATKFPDKALDEQVTKQNTEAMTPEEKRRVSPPEPLPGGGEPASDGETLPVQASSGLPGVAGSIAQAAQVMQQAAFGALPQPQLNQNEADIAASLMVGGAGGQRVGIGPAAQVGAAMGLPANGASQVAPSPAQVSALQGAGLAPGDSVKASAKGGPGMSRDPERMAKEALAQQQAAIDQAVKMETQRNQAETRLRDEANAARADSAAREMAVRQRMQQHEQQAVDAYKAGLDQVLNRSVTIDPHRYWANRGTGALIAAALGSAFSGFAGGPHIDYVQRAIDRDIDAQKFAVQEGRENARAAMTGAQNLMGMYRQMGLDDVEAEHAARSAALENVASMIDGLAAKYPAAAANGEKMKAEAKMKAAEELSKMQDRRAQRSMQWAALELKRQAAASKGAGQQLRGPQAEALGGLETAAELTKALITKFGDKNLAARVKDKAAGAVWPGPGIPGTDAAEFNITRDQYLRTIALLVDQSVLQKHDVEQWTQLIPSAGDLQGREKLQAALGAIQQKYKSKLKAFQQAGFAVNGYSADLGAAEDEDDLDVGDGFQ